MKVIIAAAGTGGHINPGIAIANKIKSQDRKSKITFIGTNRGLENDLVPRAGYDLRTIQAYGINRKITITNIKNLFKTLKGFKEAKKIVKEIKPDLVIGTGGYICGPVLMAAQKLKIPTVLHESNAFPGAAVKFLCKKTNLILAGFQDTKKRLKKAKNVIVTGTPTKIKKINFTEEQKDSITRELKLKRNLSIILIFGGSQGAESINKTLLEIIEKKLNNNYQIIWATGPKQYDKVKSILKDKNIEINNIKNMTVIPYIYNMEEVMNLSDVIVARSGAMTITEISKLGKPAIFIPFPFATENHQEYNAKVLENAKAAKIILDKELNATELDRIIKDMINNTEKLIQMGNNAKEISIDDVEDKIYNEISKLVKK